VEKQVDKLGFNAHFGKSVYTQYGYFSGTDEFRANEVNEIFKNDKIDGIISMRGGWGCARLLDKIDYQLITENAKVFSGFSDVTSLLTAIYKKTGLITFHGLMGYSSWDRFSIEIFEQIVMKGEKAFLQNLPPDEVEHYYTITGGKVKGKIIATNLTVLSSIIGSDYLPDWSDKILFVEDIAEEPYRVDRMLTQLKLAGVLDSIKGFVFGKCRRCVAETPERALTLEQVLENNLKPLKIPTYYGAMFGHITEKFTLPIGIEAEIDADAGTIQLLESAVIM
jgi:muramoyltetrapeptide carboxypeptidase